jgi:hypothetical protein
MDELHDRGQVEALLAAVAQGAADQQEQGGAQALAAGIDDVAGDFAHQGHAGVEAAADDGIDLAHVVGDQGKDVAGAGIGQDREIRRVEGL